MSDRKRVLLSEASSQEGSLEDRIKAKAEELILEIHIRKRSGINAVAQFKHDVLVLINADRTAHNKQLQRLENDVAFMVGVNLPATFHGDLANRINAQIHKKFEGLKL